MSCYNNGYNPCGYNPCATTCYKTNYNCNPCQQQPCTQTIVNLPTQIGLTGFSITDTIRVHLEGSGLRGDWVGNNSVTTLNGGGGGTLCCCPCSIVTSLSGEAGAVSGGNVIAGPVTISLTGTSATASATLSTSSTAGTFSGTLSFPSATVTCCNGVKTVTLAGGTMTWNSQGP